MPKVSVIIPTLNRREYLQKSLDAITRQDFKDYEIIVVDGGSTDGSLSLLSAYNVKLVCEREEGAAKHVELDKVCGCDLFGCLP